MQRTADFHDQIAAAHLPQAARVMDEATALDATVDVLNARAAAPAGRPAGRESIDGCQRLLKKGSPAILVRAA